MTFYKNGVISIPNVTGNIVITATAVPSVEPIVNLIDTYGVVMNNRISLTSGDNSAQTGWVSIGSDSTKLIPLSTGDVIRIKGTTVSIPSDSDSKTAICGYNADGTHTSGSGGYLHIGTSSLYTCELVNGIYIITFLSQAYANFRICFGCTDTSDLIVTRNQEIV